jgi:DNA-binding NarL/FixJ family response regulator
MRVVIADDSTLFREGVARLLEDAGFELAGTAANVEQLLLKVRSYVPDVAIVDVRMPPTQTDEGIRAAEEIFAQHPDVRILLLSQVVEAKRALDLISTRSEGLGYLLKDRVLEVDDFIDAVTRVGRGGTALDPEVVAQLVGRPRASDPLAELTEREREVLTLMAEGRSNQGIGHKLYLSPKTIEAHVHAIFMKLGLTVKGDDHRRVLAVLAYLGRD